MTNAQLLIELEQQLVKLQAQLPRHSISPSIQSRIDELEEEIAELKAIVSAD